MAKVREFDPNNPGAEVRYDGTTDEFLDDMGRYGLKHAGVLVFPFAKDEESMAVRQASKEKYATFGRILGQENVILKPLQEDSVLASTNHSRAEHARMLIRII